MFAASCLFVRTLPIWWQVTALFAMTALHSVQTMQFPVYTVYNFTSVLLNKIRSQLGSCSYHFLLCKVFHILLLLRHTVVYNPVFLLAGQFYLMKKSVKVLHYFGLDCRMLEFFKYYSYELSSKKQLLSLLGFWSPVLRKRLRFVPIHRIQPVSRRRRRIRWISVWSGSELWTLSKYSRFKLKIKNL